MNLTPFSWIGYLTFVGQFRLWVPTHIVFQQNFRFLPKAFSLYPNGYIRCTFEYLKLYPKSTTIIGYV